jgi:hypothetical protein
VGPRIVPALAASGALLAALTGCGGARVSGSSIGKLIEQDLATRGHPNARIDCPDVDDEVGRRFSCVVAGVPRVTRFEGRVVRHEGIRPVGPHGGYR